MNDMNLDEKIERAEGLLCGLVLRQPEILNDVEINKNLLSENALFYIGMTERLLSKGIELIDEVHFSEEVKSLKLNNTYEKLGGWTTVKELANISNPQNSDAIIDEFTKWNLVKAYENKGILNVEKHWDKLLKMNSGQVADYMEYQINDVDIKVTSDLNFEKMDLSNKEIQDIKNGLNMGIQFGKHSPILNYLSMGLPKGYLTMFASFINGGKSSFTFNNIVIPVVENKQKVTLCANEQDCMYYKLLLQTYVLTERLNYWKLPRKKFKSGNWSEEDEKMVNEANKIIREEYNPYLDFVKLYDYDMGKIKKIAKRQAKKGTELLVYDTMKYSGSDESSWKSLIQDSKELFQVCSKYNLAGVVTFQCKPSMKNKLRILDMEVLANGSQVGEVFSEMFAFRDCWLDEFDGEDCDIKPYRLKRDENTGKLTSEREELVLDKKNNYKIFFHFKTRNDSVGTTVLYEFKGYQNKWNELGYCTVHGKNKF